jgi:leader peptidase (prepilin peptidase)/N-methyltransferase
MNGVLYVLIFWVNGWNVTSVLYCLLTSALIVLSVIDFRTFEISYGINLFIFILGLIKLILDYKNWLNYVIGFLAVSLFLYIILIITKGRGIGGGDVKLMAACGLLLGGKQIILAFLLGCILGSVIHLIRMKVSNTNHVLALGPYLSAGVVLSALWGEQFIQWYISLYRK